MFVCWAGVQGKSAESSTMWLLCSVCRSTLVCAKTEVQFSISGSRGRSWQIYCSVVIHLETEDTSVETSLQFFVAHPFILRTELFGYIKVLKPCRLNSICMCTLFKYICSFVHPSTGFFYISRFCLTSLDPTSTCWCCQASSVSNSLFLVCTPG